VIAHLRGTVLERRPQGVVLDVNGVGYLVVCTDATAARHPVGSQASFRIHTAVREDAIELFGFSSELEETLFHELLRVQGIGPRMAMGILAGGSPQEIAAAIAGGDLARLKKLPGVGKKTAERLVVDLRERLAPFVGSTPARIAPPPTSPTVDELLVALEALGYRAAEAEQRAAFARKKLGAEAPVEELVKEALRAR
jgi:Holliday junction DNA helicase RuvA